MLYSSVKELNLPIIDNSFVYFYFELVKLNNNERY